MPEATRDSPGLWGYNSTAALCISKGRKSCRVRHFMISHQVLLQVKSIFSPVGLGRAMLRSEVRGSNITGPLIRHFSQCPLSLYPLSLALHLQYNVTVIQTPSLWKSHCTSYLRGSRKKWFLCWGHWRKDDEAFSETEQVLLHNIFTYLLGWERRSSSPLPDSWRGQMRKLHLLMCNKAHDLTFNNWAWR